MAPPTGMANAPPIGHEGHGQWAMLHRDPNGYPVGGRVWPMGKQFG
jgi:hypothetical protein